MYTCALCNEKACRSGERDKYPKNCPSREVEVIEDIDTRIGYEHSCYLDEKERGGLSEICSCGAGKQEFLNALEEGERLRNE